MVHCAATAFLDILCQTSLVQFFAALVLRVFSLLSPLVARSRCFHLLRAHCNPPPASAFPSVCARHVRPNATDYSTNHSTPVLRRRGLSAQGLQSRDPGRAVPFRQDQHQQRRPSQARPRGTRAALHGERAAVKSQKRIEQMQRVQLLLLLLPLLLPELRLVRSISSCAPEL